MISRTVRARLVVVLAFASTGLTVGTVSYSFGLFVQPLTDWSAEQQLGPGGEGWTRTSINMSVTVTFLTYSILGPAVGWAVDRYGPRKVAPLSLLSVSIGYVIFALLKSLVGLYVGSIAMAVGVGGAAQASTGKLVASWFPAKKGQVMGIVTSGNNMGGLVCINVGSLVLKHGGFRWMAGTFAIGLAATAAVFWFLVRDSPEPDLDEPQPVATEGPGKTRPLNGTNIAQARDYTLAEAIRQPCFFFATFGMACAFWTYQMVLANLIPAMQAEGFSTQAAAASVTVVAIMGFCSKLVSGSMSDKIGATLTMCGVLGVQMVALVVFLVGAADRTVDAGGSTLSTVYLWVFAVLYGSGFGGVGALLPLVVIETFGSKSFGAINGAMNVGMAVPALVAPVVAGVCFDGSGNYRLAFGMTIGVFGLGVISLLLARCCRPANVGRDIKLPAVQMQRHENEADVKATPSNGEVAP